MSPPIRTRVSLLIITAIGVAFIWIWMRGCGPTSREAVKVHLDSLSSHDWKTVYRQMPAIERERNGWTEESFARFASAVVGDARGARFQARLIRSQFGVDSYSVELGAPKATVLYARLDRSGEWRISPITALAAIAARENASDSLVAERLLGGLTEAGVVRIQGFDYKWVLDADSLRACARGAISLTEALNPEDRRISVD